MLVFSRLGLAHAFELLKEIHLALLLGQGELRIVDVVHQLLRIETVLDGDRLRLGVFVFGVFVIRGRGVGCSGRLGIGGSAIVARSRRHRLQRSGASGLYWRSKFPDELPAESRCSRAADRQ